MSPSAHAREGKGRSPGCEELDEHQSLGLDDFIEVVGGKVDDVGRGDETSQREERGVREEVLEPHDGGCSDVVGVENNEYGRRLAET